MDKSTKFFRPAKNKKVAVLVPVYKTSFSTDEKISMHHLRHYLSRYDIYFFVPERIKNKLNAKNTKIITFPDKYFISTVAYSELLNLKDFYLPFKNYKYILIYQPDALVFSSNLDKWTQKGYDYIGAPYFRPKIGYLTCAENSPISGGNGGLSLRKVESFIKVIERAEKLSTRSSNKTRTRKLWFIIAVLTNKARRKWLEAPPYCYPFNEDGFWSFEAPKYYPKFKVAPFKEALKFSFERYPAKSYLLNNKCLPFGTHAWARYDRSFWLPHLRKSR